MWRRILRIFGLGPKPSKTSCDEAQLITKPSASSPALNNGLGIREEPLDQPAENRATLLGIPQEIRNEILSYVYHTTGTLDQSIDLDLSSSRGHRWAVGHCEMTGYFYYLSYDDRPPTKSPLLVCKQLHSEMGKMQAAAFRNYWMANTFNLELDRSLLGGGDFVAEENLRHMHHIAYTSKRMCKALTLHYVFSMGSWTLTIEVSDGIHLEGRMVPVDNKLRGYKRFALLEEMSQLPMELEKKRRLKNPCADNEPLDPSIGLGFRFNELLAFLEALDGVDHAFRSLVKYCTICPALKT